MPGLRWMAQQGQEGPGRRTGIRHLIGWPKLPAAMDQYVLPLLSPAWADVTHWSGKLHQTYSCSPTLWLIWSVISPVFHFNRRDHSAVAGLSDLIKINSGVTDLVRLYPVKSLSSPGVEKTRSSNQSTSSKIQRAPTISPLTHLSKFHNLPLSICHHCGGYFRQLQAASDCTLHVGELQTECVKGVGR